MLGPIRLTLEWNEIFHQKDNNNCENLIFLLFRPYTKLFNMIFFGGGHSQNCSALTILKKVHKRGSQAFSTIFSWPKSEDTAKTRIVSKI